MKFPLILSCGHTTRISLSDPGCGCHSGERQYKNNSNEPSPVDKALDQFHGQWSTVLGNYGCQLPSGRKHGPCPVCGGKDRFRFDDKNGRGTWFCSQCEPQSGGGLLLLSRFINKTVMETAKELIGDDELKTIAPKRVHIVDHDAVRAANIEQAKKGAALLMASAVMGKHVYMGDKGFEGEWLVNGQPIYSKDGVIPAGGLLLVPVYKAGELVNVQKITEDGVKRPLFGGDMQGVHHIIDGATKNIAVVEGYATGVTVNKLTTFKTYVAFNTGNLEEAVRQVKIDYPESNIVVFGDHDEIDPAHNRRPGEYYANKAADPFAAVVALPPELGDWDDYRQKHGDDECKAAMRLAIGIKPKQPKVEQPKVESNPEPKPIPAPVNKPTPAPTPEPQQQMPAFGSWMGGASNKPNVKELDLEDTKRLPEGVNLDGVDIENPPSIAGDIVDYMKYGAHRELEGGAYAAMALQTVAMAAAGISGLNNAKTSLITITLGVSAAGKERPQQVAKEILAASDIRVYGDIRSDKDLIRAAVYDNGKCFYIKDEAHSLLASTGKQESYAANIKSTLMELSTSSSYSLPKLHVDEFKSLVSTSNARLEKTKKAKEDIRIGYNVEREQDKIKKIDFEIASIDADLLENEKLIKRLQTGIKNPCLNLAASSTPKKMASIIDEDSIESGFLGRGLIFDCGVERAPRNFDLIGKSEEIDRESKKRLTILQARVGAIAQMASDNSQARVDAEFNGTYYKMVATKDAEVMIMNIARHYDQYHYRNHSRLGALYSRLSERVTSVSSILAMDNLVNGNLVVEVEYVLYALKLTLESINHLAGNLRINEAVDGNSVEDQLEGIKEAIIKRLTVSKKDKDGGLRYKSKIKDDIKRQNYYKEIAKENLKHGQDAFENALRSLIGEGKIESIGKHLKLKS